MHRQSNPNLNKPWKMLTDAIWLRFRVCPFASWHHNNIPHVRSHASCPLTLFASIWQNALFCGSMARAQQLPPPQLHGPVFTCYASVQRQMYRFDISRGDDEAVVPMLLSIVVIVVYSFFLPSLVVSCLYTFICISSVFCLHLFPSILHIFLNISSSVHPSTISLNFSLIKIFYSFL